MNSIRGLLPANMQKQGHPRAFFHENPQHQNSTEQIGLGWSFGEDAIRGQKGVEIDGACKSRLTTKDFLKTEFGPLLVGI